MLYHISFEKKEKSADNMPRKWIFFFRNFGHEWGGKGTSQDPCSDIYRGGSAFSEPETSAVRDFITARRRTIKMYLTFHRYY